MKNIFSLVLATGILLTACKNKSKNIIVSKDGKEQVTVDPKQMQEAAEEMEKQKKELEKLTPLTTEQLKALMPETIHGTKRTNLDANSTMGAVLATAEYDMTDSTNIKLSVYDCAGAGGAGIYSLQYLGMLNVQEESAEEYTKTVDFKGAKAFEHCDKSSNECTFTYFAGGRFLITLEGDHAGITVLKDAAKELNIK